MIVDSEIRLEADGVTVDLGNHSVSASDGISDRFNLITITGNNVKLTNGKIIGNDGTNQLVNVYTATGVILENLVIDNTDGYVLAYPIVVNGSDVTLSGNISLIATLYGINLDQGKNVTENVELTFASDANVDFNNIITGIREECEDSSVVSIQFEEGSAYDSDRPGFKFINDDTIEPSGTIEYANKENRWVVTIESSIDGATVTVTDSDGNEREPNDDGKYNLPAGEFTVTSTAPGYSGTHQLVLEGGVAGGTKTATVPLSFDEPTVTVSKGTTGADGSVVLTAQASHGLETATFTYQWNDANGAIDGATSEKYTATKDGIYTVKVTASDGTSTASVTSAEVAVEITIPEPEPTPGDDDKPVSPPSGGDDEDFPPIIRPGTPSSSGDDDTVTIVACAAAAAVAAILAVFLIMAYRKD